MMPAVILLIILGSAGAIALISYLVYKYTHLQIKQEKPTEEEILKEEMDRMLKPIEDEEVAKEISDYKEEDDE